MVANEFSHPPLLRSCHPERSEGSLAGHAQILRCAQDDRIKAGQFINNYLQPSFIVFCSVYCKKRSLTPRKAPVVVFFTPFSQNL